MWTFPFVLAYVYYILSQQWICVNVCCLHSGKRGKNPWIVFLLSSLTNALVHFFLNHFSATHCSRSFGNYVEVSTLHNTTALKARGHETLILYHLPNSSSTGYCTCLCFSVLSLSDKINERKWKAFSYQITIFSPKTIDNRAYVNLQSYA